MTPARTGAQPVFAALTDPTRRRVLELIGERGEASASQLAGGLPVSRQAVQKHLVNLSDAGLVAARRATSPRLSWLSPPTTGSADSRAIDFRRMTRDSPECFPPSTCA